MNKTVYLASDHAGFHLKESLKEQLEQKGFFVEDLGAHTPEPLDDYPQYASAVARAVQENPQSFGILSCGNAQGVCITANKFNGIRAGVGFSVKSAQTMRQDDNANIICIPGRIETLDDPIKIASVFLSTPFSQETRHLRRISQIDELEKSYIKILPTILVQNPNTFVRQISNAKVRAQSTIWQIDVADGTMFESNSWFDPKEIAKIPNLPELELHLMILDPLPIIELTKFHLPTLRRVIIHAEIEKPIEPILNYARNLGLQVGIALNPETKIKSIKNLANKLDLILIMGVHPGQSNQEFLGRKIIRKIKKANKLYPHLIIEVDGGVNQKTIKTVAKAGAKQVCANSAIWQSNDPAMALETLSPNAL